MSVTERKRIGKLLVANRGEIAVRVFKTCKKLGIATVAVYSSADREAVFVRLADEAVWIGEAPARESYLRGDVVIAAAQRTGAQAIHPGYGFLSENAEFARAVVSAGLIFVGPTPEAIYAMGDKKRSKKLLASFDVPLIPGYLGDEQDDDTLAQKAVAVGFPVLLKASAGGGGKGMRIVRSAATLLDDIRSARAEATSSFGDGTLLVERYFDRGRHIEFQIFGDKHGNVIHLFERECSVQRRHQKVIEETPSPAMTPALRHRMGTAAVTIARAVRYEGAGTVEFIVDSNPDGTLGGFYFLEMNTRLQVEHPITELVTGLDLVALQIAVAEGASVLDGVVGSGAPTVKDGLCPPPRCCAIECRLYAEDPANDFLPCTGTVLAWRPAAEGDGVRYDGGITTGSEITVHYDPLLAKVSVAAPTRADALRRMDHVLAETAVLGVTTNARFLRATLQHPVFVSGCYDTHFIATCLPAPTRIVHTPACVRSCALMSAVLFSWYTRNEARTLLRHIPSGWRSTRPTAAAQTQAVRYDAYEAVVEYTVLPVGRGVTSLGGTSFGIRIRDSEGAGEDYTAAVLAGASLDEFVCVINGVRHCWVIREVVRERALPGASEVLLHSAMSGSYRVSLLSRFAATAAASGRDGPGAKAGCVAPMPGKIVAVRAALDQNVAEGDIVAVLESMKMQHNVTTTRAGKVKEVCVTVGQLVDLGAPIIVLADL